MLLFSMFKNSISDKQNRKIRMNNIIFIYSLKLRQRQIFPSAFPRSCWANSIAAFFLLSSFFFLLPSSFCYIFTSVKLVGTFHEKSLLLCQLVNSNHYLKDLLIKLFERASCFLLDPKLAIALLLSLHQ